MKALPKTPLFFPVVLFFVIAGAVFSAARIIFFSIISVPFAIYATLMEVYNGNAE